MNRIYLDLSQDLNIKRLSKILNYYEQSIKPAKAFNKGYYDGTGQAIMNRIIEDDSRPNNRIVKNYCKTITDNFRGYICGKPITYSSRNDSDISLLLDTLVANDVVNADSIFLKNALIHGEAYELCYINENQEKRFKSLDSLNSIPIYRADLDEKLLYFITYSPVIDWDSEAWVKKYRLDIYDNKYIYHYESDEGFNNLKQLSIEEHYFNDVPVSVLTLDDGKSIFDCVVGMQDAYNKLLSDEVNDFEAFVDAYMVLKNVSADEEDLAAMKQSRTILLDGDSDVAYLTKSMNDTQIENLLENLNSSIHTISNSPDFSSEEFNSGVSSGTALSYKLVGFNNIAANVQAQFIKALQNRIRLLNRVFALVESNDYDIEITFNHNLPTAIADTANVVNSLRGLVSDESLLKLLPFIEDVEAEKQRVEAQAEKSTLSDMYQFLKADEDEPREQ